MNRTAGRWKTALWCIAMGCAGPGLAGCEPKERILDVEAPGIDLEVERSGDGEVDVHVDDRPD